MKKFLVLLMFFTFTVHAEILTYDCGEHCTATLDESGVLLVSGTGETYSYNWDTRQEGPFYLNQKIKKIIIEEGITSLGSQIFSSCTNLRELVLADSVKTVGSAAFDNISYLNSITMSDTTIWSNQDELNSLEGSNLINIYCRGNLTQCEQNLMRNNPSTKGVKTFLKLVGKRIYTIEEAEKLSKPTGNTFKIRYK